RRAAAAVGLVRDRTAVAARRVARVLEEEARGSFEACGVPGLAIVVRFADGPTLRASFGRATADAPMTTDTVAQVFSLSKVVVAACALALAERGRLALDEPVWRHLGGWRLPADRAPGVDLDTVTLRRLLAHAAGFSPFEPGFCADGERPGALDLLRRDGPPDGRIALVAAPGATYRYAAGGFVLAQAVLEGASGRAYADLAHELVLAPLGLASTSFARTADGVPRLATPHDAENRPLPFRPMRTLAASGMLSTADDLATLFAAFAPGRAGEPAGRGVLTPASCAEMLRPQSRKGGGSDYGLGLYVRRKRADLRYAHSGHFVGWYGHVDGFVRRRVVVALLSNGDRGRACVETLMRRLREAVYDAAL
ncbi:MAG: beta-lactamase family protein, partial [Planctomycetia bacterium]|nr:beta-lactamase family protein [Planctomycetia bacterium]